MKIINFLGFLIILLVSSCGANEDEVSTAGNDIDKRNRNIIFKEVYNDGNIESQKFIIDNTVGDILEGSKGTKLMISKNSFVDSVGNLIIGEVEIELKEALTPIDMVMGNLTTTYNNQPLQSGGMLYLNATSNGKQIHIANGKSIFASVPSDTLLTDMSLFLGNRDSLNNINWANPKPIALPDPESDSAPDILLDAFEKSHNILYLVDGFIDPMDFPQEVQDEVSRIAWEGPGLKISKDSTFQIGEYTVTFLKQDRLYKWSQVFQVEKGNNSFVTDKNVFYIFKMKNLGWANIDRLFSDPRTEEIELIADIINHSEFNYVYTTMIIQSMYLPGYQKKDESFSFTHGDYESTMLPIGEKATIIATASKNDKTYFGYQTIDIKKKQELKIELKESSKELIEDILIEEI